jgi:hypothetical protein
MSELAQRRSVPATGPVPAARTVGGATLLLAAARIFRAAAAWAFPALLLVAVIGGLTGVWGWDFRAVYDAADAYAHHVLPYPAPSLAALTGQEGFVYPLPAATAFVPLSVLPWPVALVLFELGITAALAGALYVLGVRDWRCYGAALLTFHDAIYLGTLSPLLALMLALLWRYRDETWRAAALLAGLVLLKVFLWPLGLWLLAMRRLKSVFAAIAATLGAVVLATLPFGLSTFEQYRHVLGLLTRFEAGFSLSPLAFFLSLGLSPRAAQVCTALVAVLVVAVLVRAALRRDDFYVFRLAIALAFVCSPIVWGHYFVLLLVPLAVMRPRFTPLWLALACVPSELPEFSTTARTFWIGLTLVLAGAQLGLVPTGRLASLVPPRFRRESVAVLGVAGAALLLWYSSGLDARKPFVTALTARSSAAPANGTAFVLVGRHDDSVCWELWTQSVPGGPVRAGILDSATGRRFSLPMVLNDRGYGQGCSRLPASSDARTIRRRPESFDLVVDAPRAGARLSGPLRDRPDAGRPPQRD